MHYIKAAPSIRRTDGRRGKQGQYDGAFSSSDQYKLGCQAERAPKAERKEKERKEKHNLATLIHERIQRGGVDGGAPLPLQPSKGVFKALSKSNCRFSVCTLGKHTLDLFNLTAAPSM